jgi:hypothetical protein
MEPEGSLPHSQEPATCPYPEIRTLLQWTNQGKLDDRYHNTHGEIKYM